MAPEDIGNHENICSMLIEFTQDIIAVVDRSGQFHYVNKYAADQLNKTMQDIIGKHFSDLFPAAVAQRMLANVEKVFASGELSYTENPLVLNDQEVWQGTKIIPLRDKGANSGFDRILIVSRDITTNKQIEQSLKENEEQFRQIIQQMPLPIEVADPSGTAIMVNKAFLELFQLPSAKSIVGIFNSLNEPLIRELGLLDIIKDVRNGHSVFIPEVALPLEKISDRYAVKRMGTIYLEITIFPVFMCANELWRVVSVWKDITERKKMEESLRLSEEKYRTLLQEATEVIILADPLGNLLELNKKAEMLLGYNREEIVRMNFCNIHPPSEHLRIIETFKEIILKGSARIYDTSVLTKDGRIIPIDISGSVVEYGGKEVCQGIFRDMTERKAAELKLSKVNEELNASNKKLKQMAVKDPHTGLFNHKYLTDILEREFVRAKKYNHPLSLILVDIDYFKAINDTYGHHTGDQVLKQLAHVIKRLSKKEQSVIRYAGEEFLILAPDTNKEDAINQAQKLLDEINIFKFGDRKRPLRLRVSMAVCSYPEDKVLQGMELLEKADLLISKAKEWGGNRVLSSLDLHLKKIIPLVKNSRKLNVKELKKTMARLNKRSNQNAVEAIFAFGKAIELKDHYTGDHVDKTVHYATEIAKALKLSSEDIMLIKQASMLHDLGKIGISDNVLLKPAKLTSKEYMEIKKHPTIGADIIRPIHLLHGIIPHILYHHERWDGKGYPAKLKGEKIPLGARIIALADVYQALTSNRPYRKAYAKAAALKIIKRESGSHFDPRIVNAFLQVLKKIK